MKISILLPLLLVVGYTQSFDLNDELLNDWQKFKEIFNKTYANVVEERNRLRIFVKNSLMIADHNRLFSSGLTTFTMKMNDFGDMLHSEFVKIMNGFKSWTRTSKGSPFVSKNIDNLPESIDWRERGCVTPVKNQGSCGSCWSFSAVGAMEGAHCIKTGKLISLSEQNLIDCSSSYGNQGCNGGLMDNAFNYTVDNNGVDTEESYPYEAKVGPCRYNSDNVGTRIKGFVDIPSGDEQKLKEAVATVGPVSVAIDASHLSLQFYSKGVYNEWLCSSTRLDHGVLLVGYGEQDRWISLFGKQKYWLVKNSWGVGWGEEGYVKIARDNNNKCGIASMASYPVL